MLYNHLTLWTEQNGQVWHSMKCWNPACGWTRDMSMGAVRNERDMRNLLDWAKMHRMTIVDNRKVLA